MKFSKGETVIMLPAKNPDAIRKYGSGFIDCEIFQVGPFNAGYYCATGDMYAQVSTDYVVRMEDGDLWFCSEQNLRKRRPPEQPADDQEFIDWFRKITKQEPLETVMQRTLENLSGMVGNGS